jgi:hypothetical protein
MPVMSLEITAGRAICTANSVIQFFMAFRISIVFRRIGWVGWMGSESVLPGFTGFDAEAEGGTFSSGLPRGK